MKQTKKEYLATSRLEETGMLLILVRAILRVAAPLVGPVVHVVLHQEQIAVALRQPQTRLVQRRPPRQVRHAQPLGLEVNPVLHIVVAVGVHGEDLHVRTEMVRRVRPHGRLGLLGRHF